MVTAENEIYCGLSTTLPETCKMDELPRESETIFKRSCRRHPVVFSIISGKGWEVGRDVRRGKGGADQAREGVRERRETPRLGKWEWE